MKSLKNFRNEKKSKTMKNKNKRKKRQKQKPHSKYKMKGGDVTNVLETPFLSMASNSDPNYIEKGIVFFTRSKGIDAFTDAGTTIFNFFGESGFEGGAYEYCKLECLQGLLENIPDKNNQKLCNVKIDVETNNKQTIFAHGYGQLYELKNKSSNNKTDATDTKTDNII
jgi:hypothetical protein